MPVQGPDDWTICPSPTEVSIPEGTGRWTRLCANFMVMVVSAGLVRAPPSPGTDGLGLAAGPPRLLREPRPGARPLRPAGPSSGKAAPHHRRSAMPLGVRTAPPIRAEGDAVHSLVVTMQDFGPLDRRGRADAARVPGAW